MSKFHESECQMMSRPLNLYQSPVVCLRTECNYVIYADVNSQWFNTNDDVI